MSPRVRLIGNLLICLSAAAGCQRTVVPPQPMVHPPGGIPSQGPALEQIPAGEPQSSRSEIPHEWQVDGSREWRHIVIHHTATSRGSVESIHETHLRRKDKSGNPWMGIGYHFVIGNGEGMGDGAIEPTFRWREQLHGAHAGDHEFNQHGIGVVLVGNFEETPPSSRQVAAVKRLVAFLKHEYDIPADRIVGHDEVKTTACPGKHFPLAEVRQAGLNVTALPSDHHTARHIAGIE